MPSLCWSGQLVRLRPAQAEDIEPLVRARLEDHDAMRMHGEGFIPPPPSRQAILEELTAPAPPTAGDDALFVIARLEDDLAVGSLNVWKTRPQSGWFWLALTVFAEHRRSGFGRDAVRVALRGYFDELRYHKVNVNVFDPNEPSRRLFESLGFSEEGRLREVAFSEGRHYDERIFGMTAAEFRRQRAQAPASS